MTSPIRAVIDSIPRPRRARLRRPLTSAGAAARAAWSSGWIADGILFIGWFAGSYWVSQFFPRVWPLAIAILCFAIGGIKFAANLAWHGFYALGNAKERKP